MGAGQSGIDGTNGTPGLPGAKGEKGTTIWRPVNIPTGKIDKTTGEQKFKSVPKYWSVFNEQQTEEIVVS